MESPLPADDRRGRPGLGGPRVQGAPGRSRRLFEGGLRVLPGYRGPGRRERAGAGGGTQGEQPPLPLVGLGWGGAGEGGREPNRLYRLTGSAGATGYRGS